MDRQGTGLAILRMAIGVFFIFEGISKIRWFADASILAARLADWANTAPAGSIAQAYLQRFAIPGIPYFARLVPLGELCCGTALLIGFWTPLAAFVALFMAINFHVGGGTLFRYSFLTNGYGLPVIGSTLALVIGGVRLRWSVR